MQKASLEAKTAAEAARDANLANTAAMTRWKELAAAEASAITDDVTRAKGLLEALTHEVADEARLEAAARTALETAK